MNRCLTRAISRSQRRQAKRLGHEGKAMCMGRLLRAVEAAQPEVESVALQEDTRMPVQVGLRVEDR